jgi:hypothetical protein
VFSDVARNNSAVDIKIRHPRKSITTQTVFPLKKSETSSAARNGQRKNAGNRHHTRYGSPAMDMPHWNSLSAR